MRWFVVLVLAVLMGCAQSVGIDGIQVRLDPSFDSRKGLGPVERTRVTFKITSAVD